MEDSRQIQRRMKDAYSQKDIGFNRQFNFEINDNQKKVGTELLISDIVKTIKKIKAVKGAITIASLGIGDGKVCSRYSQLIDSQGNDLLIGIDLHAKFLNQACSRISGLIVHQYDFNNISQQSHLPIGESQIDIAECCMVGHHIGNLPTFIREVDYLLVKGGMFFYLDLIDKTCLEDCMVYHEDHEYPKFHGVEFFRNHYTLKNVISHYMAVIQYVRIGPGIAYLVAEKV